MKTRLAKYSDLPQLKTMFDKVVKNMDSYGVCIWNEYYPYEEFERDIERQQLYLLMDEEVIVATFVLYEFKTTCLDCLTWQENTAKAMLLNRFGVNVDYLRQGMGVKALDEAKRIAKNQSAKYIRLTVVDSNTPAINLYKKYGFTKVDGIYEEYIPESNTTLYEYGFEIKLKGFDKWLKMWYIIANENKQTQYLKR